jgi:chromosome segregation ATPase
LEELSHLFSDRLDPLWLASREQEMISVVNTYKEEAEHLNGQIQNLLAELQQSTDHNAELQKRTSRLEKRKFQLEERATELRKEKKDLQKHASKLEKRVSHLEKRKNQLEERSAAVKEEKKALQGHTSRLEQRNSRLEERNSRLKEERLLLDSQLSEYRTSGRYKLADTVTRNVLRIPGAKALARRTRPKE